MEFALSQDQRLMQDSLRNALTRVCPLDRIRNVANRSLAYDTDVWQAARNLGTPALLVPEKHGGLGLSLLDAAIASEEFGRCVVPAPFLGSSVLAPIALCEAGSDEQQARWLPGIASGQLVIGVALAQALDGVRKDSSLRIENGRLSGNALFALDGALADAYIIADRSGALYLVDANAEGLRRTQLHNLDATRPSIELHFERAMAQPLPGATPATLARLRDSAWVMLAADTLGAGWAMIEKAVAYAGDRHQFGRAIASFQAVKHMCAEMASGLEIRRALVWYAAHALSEKLPDATLYAAHSKAQMAEIGRFVARTATEVHGGIGITDELGLHYWFKRIEFNRQTFGSPERVRQFTAALQGFGTSP